MIVLDKIDRQLLFELDRNSRETVASISRKLRMSQETARYRIRKLYLDGVISKSFTIIESARLGINYYKFFLKYQGMNHAARSRVVQRLAQNPVVAWLVSLEGTYDIGVVVRAAGVHQLDIFLEELARLNRKYPVTRSFSINLSGEYLSRTYLQGGSRRTDRSRRYISGAEMDEKIDRTDELILHMLCEDSRVTHAEMCERLLKYEREYTPEGIALRIKRLERSGIIKGYNLLVDTEKLGWLHYKVLFWLDIENTKRMGAFFDYCRGHPHVVYIVRAIGAWDVELDIEVETVVQFRQVLSEIVNQGPVRDTNSLLVSKIYKYTLFETKPPR